MNPLLPAAYDVAWAVVCAGIAALAVAALVSMFRRAPTMGRMQRVWWVLVVFALPVVGAVGWFLVGRPADENR